MATVVEPLVSTNSQVIGHVVQISGPAVDCQFPEGQIPEVHTAIRIVSEGFDVPSAIDVVCETEQHIGEGRIRTIAMQATEGMVRGMKAISLGEPISVPVGKQTLGRVLNVLGAPVDEMGPVNTEKRYPIHRPAPSFEDQSTRLEMFETGIKVVDLLETLPARRQDRPLRRRGRRQDGHHSGTQQQHRHEARRRVGSRRSRRADAREGNDLWHEMQESGVIPIRRTGPNRKSR